jgi:curved DNA-binding protein CbpA
MLKHYLTLKISFPATDQEVRQAYLDLVKRFSPERHPKAFARITEAYEALKDETVRIHTQLKGFADINYPEEEILLLGRLKKLYGSQIGLRDLIEADKRPSRE